MADGVQPFRFLAVAHRLLMVCGCDWVAGRIDCEVWSGEDTTAVQPLLDIVHHRQLKQYELRQRSHAPLYFMGYITAYWATLYRPGIMCHRLTVTMDGPLMREDDTIVEGVNEVQPLHWGVTPHV